MSYIAEIESRVAGIPCLIGVSHFDCVQGSYSYNAKFYFVSEFI